ncbi:uncharacterized protein PG986_008766 [Apiospora aurea]|uniref:Uncharacterized protein n=1 Tax=Apiospora aurea TaxID=335848 RepID=A0ABR1Q5R7_9PEZI
MARVTTILTLSLVAVTALATGNGDLPSGGAFVERNEMGLEGLRQPATRNMLDVDAMVGRSPYERQEQGQQIDGTSATDRPVSITPAPTEVLNGRQLPPPPPGGGIGGGGRGGAQPLPNPDTGSAASALASLSAQSSSDVAKASAQGFSSGSAVAAAQASSQIASISASLSASLSSALASVTATATPGQQLPVTLTVTETLTSTAAPAQQPPVTATATDTDAATITQTLTKPDLLPPPLPPTTSNGLISDPRRGPDLVDLTVGQLAAALIGTIIGTAFASVLLTLLFTRCARRQKSGEDVYGSNGDDDSNGSQTALRTTYAGEEKGGALPTEVHPAERRNSHQANPSESWSNVRNSIFGTRSSPPQSRPESGQVEVRTAHKRTISNGSKPRLIRLGSRDDRLTPVTERSQESARSRGGLIPPSEPPSRQVSTSRLNLNPPNAPFLRNPSGDAVSWGSWGPALPDPETEGHMAVLLKEPPRHQHNASTSSSGSSKIMDANQLKAAMMADGTIDPPPLARKPNKHERRPSSGTLGVMGGDPAGRLDGPPPNMSYPLPSFAQYDQQGQPPQVSYWSPTDTTTGTDCPSPISSIDALKAFPQPQFAEDRRSTHGRVQSMSSSRYSTTTTNGGLARNLSERSDDSSHRRSASVNSFLLTSSTIHTNGATFSLFPAPNHGAETPPMPTRSQSNASASARRNPTVPRAISAVAPPMPKGNMAGRYRGADMA